MSGTATVLQKSFLTIDYEKSTYKTWTFAASNANVCVWADESHLQSLYTSVPHLWEGDNDISILSFSALFSLLNSKAL